MLFLILLALIYIASSVHKEALLDEIKSVPGWNGSINFKQYSGYLNASKTKFLHYWLVFSQRSPAKDPVLLWLNGGPGCSSLEGLMSENGPFTINSDGRTLSENKYSWNKVANVLYLEAPIGVGFSYSLDKNYTTDDDTTSSGSYTALQHFFKKFPEFKKNKFYISGESYAGVYIPTLAVRVLDGEENINLKGFAIGNGMLDKDLMTHSLVFFFYYHGIIGDEIWANISKNCCTGAPSKSTCKFSGNVSVSCTETMIAASSTMDNPKLNVYNLYAKCLNSSSKHSRDLFDRQKLLSFFQNKEEKVEYRSTEGVPCMDTETIERYFNQKSVQEAIHVSGKVDEWSTCNNDFFKLYDTNDGTMRPQIKKLIDSGKLRGLLYAGDMDTACNFLGIEWFISSLNYTLEKGYKTWEYENQIAGFVKYYTNLTFLTVRGSGHMVPQDKPGPALKMITNFLSDLRY